MDEPSISFSRTGTFQKSEVPVTLHPGQTWYEGPNDIHTIGRNASKTKPAKFLVLLLKDQNTPVLIPVK